MKGKKVVITPDKLKVLLIFPPSIWGHKDRFASNYAQTRRN
jgi:hypothetical protein